MDPDWYPVLVIGHASTERHRHDGDSQHLALRFCRDVPVHPDLAI